MTPLDAARRLVEDEDLDSDYGCCFCQRFHKHRQDCPTVSLPAIVAALEAAERVAQIDPSVNLWSHSGNDYWCYACDAHLFADSGEGEEPHAPDCVHQTLVAALKGEPASVS